MFYESWYPQGDRLIASLIRDYLTPLALAVWFMDDGSCQQRRVKFSTNSFTYDDCVFLNNLLFELYGLHGSVCKAGYADRYVIILSTRSFLDFKQ